jgi:hypothetical protein
MKKTEQKLDNQNKKHASESYGIINREIITLKIGRIA